MRRSTRAALEALDTLSFKNSAEERAHRDYAESVKQERLNGLAGRAIQGHAADVARMRDRLAAELQAIKDSNAKVAKSLRDGDVDSAEAGRLWIDLRQRRRALIDRSSKLVSRAADTAEQGADPAAYLHSLETRFPSTQHEWPW